MSDIKDDTFCYHNYLLKHNGFNCVFKILEINKKKKQLFEGYPCCRSAKVRITVEEVSK